MQIFNRTKIKFKEDPSMAIMRMTLSLPKRAIPKYGLPNFHLTNNLLHSYAVMYERHRGIGEKEHQDFFFRFRKQKVWAFTAFKIKEPGNVYLAIGERMNNSFYRKPSEFTVFHEIGHHWHLWNVPGILPDDKNAEILADEYAMACFLNYVIKENLESGFCGDFDRTWRDAISTAKEEGLNGVNFMKIGREIAQNLFSGAYK